MSDVATAWLLENYQPGSQGAGWTWEHEAQWLLAQPCYCPMNPDGSPREVETCGQPGHYQLRMEDHLRTVGRIDQGVCLGNDGRVWDGHHRIVAAMRLGFDRIPLEES